MQKLKEPLPPSIISLYKKYENPVGSFKKQLILAQPFEIDERYEIIDISQFFFIQIFLGCDGGIFYLFFDKFNLYLSWNRNVWNSCCLQGSQIR